MWVQGKSSLPPVVPIKVISTKSRKNLGSLSTLWTKVSITEPASCRTTGCVQFVSGWRDCWAARQYWNRENVLRNLQQEMFSGISSRKCSQESAAGNVLRNQQQKMFSGIRSRKCSQEFAAKKFLRNLQAGNVLRNQQQEMFSGICSRKCS